MQIANKEGGGDDKKPLTTQRRLRITGEKTKGDPIGSRLPNLGTSKTGWLPATCRDPRPVDRLL